MANSVSVTIFVLCLCLGASFASHRHMLYQDIMKNAAQLQNVAFQEQFEKIKNHPSPAQQLFLNPSSGPEKSKALTPWKLLHIGTKVANIETAKVNGRLDCLYSLNDTTYALMKQEKWALKMIDAMGKPGSGILEGNIVWLGSFSECLDVQATKRQLDNSTRHLFDGRYCLVKFQPPGPVDPSPFDVLALTNDVNVGLCVPSTCSESDVEVFLNLALKPLNGSLKAVVVNYQPKPISWSISAIAVTALLSVVGVAILLGTLYDICLHQRALQKSKSMMVTVVDPSQHHTITDDVSANTEDYTPLLKERQEQSESLLLPERRSVPMRILLALSIYTNGQKILNAERTPGSLDCVHGIRFLSMTWVILGHTISFLMAFCSNLLRLEEWLNRWTFQAIGNATVSVDSFFVLSGTLVSYLLLKQLKNKNGPRHINWAMFYFHRFWRLTPAYMLVLGTHVTVLQYWGTGPVWPFTAKMEPDCNVSWWTNLLYINNIVHTNKQCMAWGWYLANDMQFFIISPLVIIGFYYKWFVGGIMSLALILINFLSSGLLVHEGKAISEDIYVKPWCRIGPYVVGIVTGYLLHITERNKPKIHKAFVALGWVLATACNLAVLYGLTSYKNGLVPMPVGLSAFYTACSRTAWGLGLAWVIFACCRGYGGFVNTLLSWPAIIPLSRLTYAAYLVHPVVIYYYFLSLNQTLYVNEIVYIWVFLGGLVVSYAVAFVASLAFEAPMMGLEKVVFPK